MFLSIFSNDLVKLLENFIFISDFMAIIIIQLIVLQCQVKKEKVFFYYSIIAAKAWRYLSSNQDRNTAA